MSILFFELVFILILIVGNGILAMSEIAIVAAKRSRLHNLADLGSSGAAKALELAQNPNQFLSTVQIGITLIGILAGVFGGATIAEQLREYFELLPLLERFAESLSLGLVVIVITFFTLIIGELVPKRLGLALPEKIASVVARPMKSLATLMHPIVFVLSSSTEFVLNLLRVPKATEQTITEEEIRILIRQAALTGVLETVEKDIVERVLHFGDRRVGSIMTPRPDIEWINLAMPYSESILKIARSSHSRFPVGRGRLHEFQGVVTKSDLFESYVKTGQVDVAACLKMPLFVPETMNLLRLLDEFRKAKTEIAMIVDEYGTITGIVTLKDVLETIVGDVPTTQQNYELNIVPREDGSWLVDGMSPVEEFEEATAVKLFDEEEPHYNTVSGFVLSRLGRLPKTGDKLEASGLLFEIVDMDGKRIDKILVTPSKKRRARGRP